MAQLNALPVESSHPSLDSHPLRKALILLLAGAGTTIAAAQQAQRVHPLPVKPATTHALVAENHVPSVAPDPISSASTPAPAPFVPQNSPLFHSHPPRLPEISEKTPYFYEWQGQMMRCQKASTSQFTLGALCQATNAAELEAATKELTK